MSGHEGHAARQIDDEAAAACVNVRASGDQTTSVRQKEEQRDQEKGLANGVGTVAVKRKRAEAADAVCEGGCLMLAPMTHQA